MTTRAFLTFTFVIACSTGVEAQREPPVDSLIAHFLQRGILSGWQPGHLFDGCPDLASWQRRGFHRLASANLTSQRTNDLAMAWMVPLRDCKNRDLEAWYFSHLNAAIQKKQDDHMLSFWIALGQADSPTIRDYLREVMLDTTVSMATRDAAGTQLFARFDPESALQEYLRAFQTMNLPFETANAQNWKLLNHAPERLLREVGQRVRANARVADQIAFWGIVQTSSLYANTESRRQLSEDLQSGLDRASTGITGARRAGLEEAVRQLKRPKS